jgi:predicted AAA+ superfamily ATPase
MFYQRKILEELIRQLSKPEIIVLTGMRRVGKTTLLQMVFEKIEDSNKVFLDLSNPINQRIFEETNYDNIWANLKTFGITKDRKSFVFLYEIQDMPEIVNVVKYLYDHYKVKFYLTGSSSFYLKNLFPESLSGRKAIFELFPLDFEEFLIFKNIKKDFNLEFKLKDKNKNLVEFERIKKFYDEYMEFGGFPQVVLEEDFNRKKMWLDDIFKSYFEKDVKSLADFKEINLFRDLILLLLKRVGSKLEISKLSSEIGVSRETIYSYLYFLKGTYFIFLLSPFTKNIDREVSSTKKMYICDNGFIGHFGHVDEGSLFENSVYHNLKKYGEVRYYQRYKGAEIDFILMGTGDPIAIETKINPNIVDLRYLERACKNIGISNYYIVTKNFSADQGFIPSTDI